MNMSRPPARALLVVMLLATVVGPPAAHAARTATKTPRIATATGPLVERSRPVWGDLLSITAASRTGTLDAERAGAAIDAALDSAARLEDVFAPDADAGELARLNRSAATERFACSADLYATLDAALATAAETDGAYDPTAGPLARLWRQPSGGPVPDDLALADARQLVGWRLLVLEPGGRTVRFRRPGMELALDAVAVGRILERAAAVLRERGIARARLELAGETLAFTNHDAWSVTVRHPDPDRGPAMHLQISNAALATLAPADRAGSPGVFDPRTGRRPSGDASVTVVTASALRARALAEALCVLGRDGAAEYARDHGDVGVLWLEPLSDGLRAWAWNLGAVTAEPGLRVEWKDSP